MPGPYFGCKLEKLWNERQSAHYEGLFYSRSHRVRVRIKRDIYEFQSYAIAEIFSTTENQWKPAARVPYPMMNTLKRNNGLTAARSQQFEADIDALLAEVALILPDEEGTNENA